MDLQWRTDNFVTKIAGPLLGKEIAIVSEATVQSTLTINAGITGRDMKIGGNFSRVEAVDLAASIMGIAPSAVRVDSTGATTT